MAYLLYEEVMSSRTYGYITQNCKSGGHIPIFFLNIMHMRFFVDPNAAEVKLIVLMC